jgi:predicted alpha/beta hydrolase
VTAAQAPDGNPATATEPGANAHAAPEIVTVHASDGAASELRLFPSARPTRHAILCLPAMGVPARFYDPLAQALAARGLDVAVAELRGHGTSSVRPGRAVDFGYAELVERDWPAACAAVRARFPGRVLIGLGHSLGGHVHALAAAAQPDVMTALVLVASGSPYWRGFPPQRRPVVAALAQLAPVVAALVGHFPGDRIGFGGREARRLIGDWARLARTGRFAPSGTGRDFEAALARLACPVLVVTIDGDSFAPPAAVERLCRKLRTARLERWRWRAPRAGSRWHFQWARRPDAIADRVAGYVKGIAAT